jgi:hypothetical protein
MTTQTQPETKTYCCSYCGLERPFSQLVHNGMGFLFCPEEVECYERSQEQGKAILTELQLRLEKNNVERSELIQKIKQVRHVYKLPDPAQVEHEKWLAEIRADEEC